MRAATFEELRDGGLWDEYVVPRARGPGDLPAWRHLLCSIDGLACHRIGVQEAGKLVGALELTEFRHPIFGHYLSTAAFGTDGGIFFDHAAAKESLLAQAKALAGKLGVRYLAIRAREEFAGFEVDRRFCTSMLRLSADADAQLAALPAKTRNQVRRGMREGFQLAVGHDQIQAFTQVLHRHMRDLGSPAHGQAYYEEIAERFGSNAEFYVVRDGEQLVAGALLFFVNDTASNYHTIALRDFNRRCPNYLLYWRMIEAAIGRGCTWFDMGRSTVGSTQHEFKGNWRTETVALGYNYHLLRSKRLPTLDPANPKLRLAIGAWTRLPVAVTQRIGPLLISGIA